MEKKTVFAPRNLGYDRGITIFSPDGRLFQVEYAIEAVKRGTTAIGIRSKEGIVLAVEKRAHTALIEPESVKKIFMVDKHVGVAIAGLTADARVLVDQLRLQAQINRLTYDEPATVELLTRKIGDIKQYYTLHAGARPFGVSLLIAGVDDVGPHLFLTEPSGSFWGHQAAAIGSGFQVVTEFLEESYKADISLEDSIVLSLQALKRIFEGGIPEKMVEIAVIDAKDRKMRILSDEEIQKYIKRTE